VVGDKNHEETIGILGSIKKGILLEKVNDVKKAAIKLKNKIAVICQSTQSITNVARVVAKLAEYVDEMLFINTICQPTRLRQKEIQKLALASRAVLIVGSKKSANTKRLYEEAKK
jgi:4-hydroxy-3-methylbut-2-enyl diphosphate reductase